MSHAHGPHAGVRPSYAGMLEARQPRRGARNLRLRPMNNPAPIRILVPRVKSAERSPAPQRAQGTGMPVRSILAFQGGEALKSTEENAGGVCLMSLLPPKPLRRACPRPRSAHLQRCPLNS